jgi:hypothetical protein
MYLIESDDLLMRVDEKSYKQSSCGKKGNIVLPLLLVSLVERRIVLHILFNYILLPHDPSNITTVTLYFT